MTINLTPEAALVLIEQLLIEHEQRAAALSTAVFAQRAINNNPVIPGGPLQSSQIQFPLQDAELLADAFPLMRQMAELKLELK